MMIKRVELEERLLKWKDFINVPTYNAKNPMGKYFLLDCYLNTLFRSEGSLFQHIKLKHPELTEDPDWKMKLLGTQAQPQS